MADTAFNTPAGQAPDRESLVAFLNVASSSGTPEWSPLGDGVTDSSMEYDWQKDSSKDIRGVTRTTVRKPIITEDFDTSRLDSGSKAITKLWNLAVKEQNPAALANQDMLVVHAYAGTEKTAAFAERYSSCTVLPTRVGGEGGGAVDMDISVTFGGTRTIGSAAIDGDTVTFTAD